MVMGSAVFGSIEKGPVTVVDSVVFPLICNIHLSWPQSPACFDNFFGPNSCPRSRELSFKTLD